MKELNAVVVDRNLLTRLAVKILLEKINVSIVGESDDGLHAITIIKEINPDIVITDTDINSMSGIELVDNLRRDKFSGIIIVTSEKNCYFYSIHSSEAGANGFVRKNDFMQNIFDCIKASINGYSYFPFKLSSSMGELTSDESVMKLLSSQEVKVLNAILIGMKNKEIAYKMGISHKTVSTYKKRLFEKLVCNSTFELLGFAVRNNIITHN